MTDSRPTTATDVCPVHGWNCALWVEIQNAPDEVPV